MGQNLISLNFTPDDIAAITESIELLEQKLGGLVELSVDDRRSLSKMGDKSEAFCRQAITVMAQNRQIIPPSVDIGEAEADLRNLDQLRPIFSRLRTLVRKANDTEMALGSDILSFALEGYALARVFGKGASLDELREATQSRFGRRRKGDESSVH